MRSLRRERPKLAPKQFKKPMPWTSCAAQESSIGPKLSIVGSDGATCDLRPRARDHLAGKIATASISNKAPGRASSGTPIVVLAGGADVLTYLSRISRNIAILAPILTM